MLALLLLTLCSPAVKAGASVTSFRPSSWVPPAARLLQDGAAVEDETSLLQLQVSVLQNNTPTEGPEGMLYMRRAGPGFPPQCGRKHPKDLYRPVAEVLAEHPGIDGNCYFQFAAFWIGYSPGSDYTKQARNGVLGMRYNTPQCCQNWKGHNSAPEETARFELGTVTSHRDCAYYSYDDLYFYSLGWLKNQRLDGSLMTDPMAWRALAAEECAKIQAEYHFTPEETTVGKHLDDNPGISTHSACAWGDDPLCKRVTVREFKLHVYTKCLLGHAADEMAYGYMRACLLPGNAIGHGKACGICPDGKVCP